MAGEVPYQAGLTSRGKQNDISESGKNGSNNEDSVDGYDFDTDGSIMIVVATNAPLTSRNLNRLAKRAMMGVARTGGFASNGSGDYVIAFSTHNDVRRAIDSDEDTIDRTELTNSAMSPLFLATVEATEEAILNSLFMAEPMTGHDGSDMDALPTDEVMEIMKEYNAVD